MKLIPSYPRFVGIDLFVRDELVDFTNRFPAYSDFNFVNLFCWNHDSAMAVSWLNGNLVIRFRDYVTNETFYSFIGDSLLVLTAQTLLQTATQVGHMNYLKLIPEICAQQLLTSQKFTISEDEDNHDYLLSIPTLSTIQGGKQAHTREQVNRFVREHGALTEFYELDLNRPGKKDTLCKIFETREGIKQDNDEDNELQAFLKLLDQASLFDLHTFGVLVAGELKAFIICEISSGNPVIAHFWKADTELRGIYHFLLHNVAKVLDQLGHSLLNFEQDLGIPGLRAAKQYLRPVGYLKKYTVALLAPLEAKSPENVQQFGVGHVRRQLAGTID
jgi:hypothetical protein